MRRNAGFTLLELFICLAVIALLLGMGVPAFRDLIRNQQLAAASSDFLSALHLARSEALKRGRRITLCKSPDGTHCAAEDGWDQGWMLFVDRNSDGSRQDGEEIIAVREGLNGMAGITGNLPVQRYISYVSRGLSRTVGGALQMGTVTVCREGRARKIILSATGRPRLQRDETC